MLGLMQDWPLTVDNPEALAERLPQMTLASSLTAGSCAG